MTQIELAWTPAEPCTFAGKPAVKRTAAATPAFWDVYRAHKNAMYAAGYRVWKDTAGRWNVTQYRVNEPVQADPAAAIAASRATSSDANIPAPDGLAYLPYQRAGIAAAAGRPATLLGDEMGLGKTIQAIGVANTMSARKILIICPASLRLNWLRELNKWLIGIDRLWVKVIDGRNDWPDKMPDVVIINYDVLEQYSDQLRSLTWDLLVADECHYLKNPKAKRTRQVIGYRDRNGILKMDPIPATRRILMTGTPIVNRPVELYPLINYLDPSRWMNFFRFAKRYCGAFQTRWGWDFKGASNLDELQEILRSTVLIRRLKKDVLTDLPPKVRQVIALPANGLTGLIERERARYETVERQVEEARVAAELAKASDDPQVYIDAVRRLRDRTAAAFTEMSRLRHETALAKVPSVLEHIENTSGKLVIMAHHKDVIAQIVAGLKGIDDTATVAVITGDVSLADRQAAVDAFQNDPRCRWFVGSIQAAGLGITLTAASHVVFAELDWVPGNVSQAEDRCHRIGQKGSVLVQHIVLDGSLDARLANTIVSKQAVIDAALDVQHDRPPVEPAAAQPEFDLETAMAAAAHAIATASITRERVFAEAEGITDEVRKAVLEGLRILAGMDHDGARLRNDVGYNATDTHIGRSLAAQSILSARQTVLGRVILRKYWRQIPGDLYAAIYPE